MELGNKKLLTRLKTARGQIDGIINMIETDRYCIDISNQLLATISLLKSTNKLVLSNHLHHCVKASMKSRNETEVDQKLIEIDTIIDKLSK